MGGSRLTKPSHPLSLSTAMAHVSDHQTFRVSQDTLDRSCIPGKMFLPVVSTPRGTPSSSKSIPAYEYLLASLFRIAHPSVPSTLTSNSAYVIVLRGLMLEAKSVLRSTFLTTVQVHALQI